MSDIIMYGFVYIWYDKKHKRYYIGSHWGTASDGYICSSKWMKRAYQRRPDDFKRRIIAIITTTRKELLEEEQKWLSLIPDEELGSRYYNHRKLAAYHWTGDPEKREFVIKAVSSKNKGRKLSPEQRRLIGDRSRGRKHTVETKKKMSDGRMGMTFTEEHRLNLALAKRGKLSPKKGITLSDEQKKNMSAWNKGKTTSQDTKDKMSQKLKGMKWYTDGVRDLRVRDGEMVPEGFRPGRTKGLDNLSMLAEKWNDLEYRAHMSNIHKKPKIVA